MKKVLKKSMSILLAFTLLFGSLEFGFSDVDWSGLAVKAEATTYSGTCGENLTWTLNTETGELVISGTGHMYGWNYSSKAPWYNNRSSIKHVTIGNGVTSIGKYAFYKYTNLTGVTISNSVTDIDYGAFRYTSLTSITIPDSVARVNM